MRRGSGRVRSGPLLLAVLLGAAGIIGPRAPGEASAQESPIYGAGWIAGGTHVGPLNADARPVEGAGSRELAPGAGWILGLHFDRWYGGAGRLGLRYQGTYQQPRFDWTSGTRKIDAASGSLSLLVRLRPPEEAAVLPYLGGGAGGIWYDLGRDVTSFPEADAFHDGGSRITPFVLVAAGADVPVPRTWHGHPMRVRIEVADHVALRSPFQRVTDGSRHGPVHHLRFTLGLHSAFSP